LLNHQPGMFAEIHGCLYTQGTFLRYGPRPVTDQFFKGMNH